MTSDVEALPSGAEMSARDLSPDQFETFYSECWPTVFKSLAATVGDRDLAGEAVDEAMARAYARWPKVREMENPQGWVYRVAYRWAIDRLRRRNVERKVIGRFRPETSAGDPTVEPKLSPALASLPVGQRAVVILACVFEWRQAEIADVLGIRVGTVKSRLHRGLERLREELES